MKKLLFILTLFIGIVSCQTEPNKIFNFDIKGDFEKYTTIKSRVKKDSLGKEFLDTISVVHTFVDKNQKTKKMVTNVYVKNEITQKIESDFKYNLKGQISKEKVKMEKEASDFEIDYIYKDNKLIETNSISEFDDFIIGINEKYIYNSDNKLTNRIFEQFTFDLKDKDTMSQQNANFLYDNNEVQIESDWSDDSNDHSNFNEFFFYNDSGLLIEKKRYYKTSKEIDTIIFKYEYDKNNNWIERKSFENGTIKQLTERIIKYK